MRAGPRLGGTRAASTGPQVACSTARMLMYASASRCPLPACVHRCTYLANSSGVPSQVQGGNVLRDHESLQLVEAFPTVVRVTDAVPARLGDGVHQPPVPGEGL